MDMNLPPEVTENVFSLLSLREIFFGFVTPRETAASITKTALHNLFLVRRAPHPPTVNPSRGSPREVGDGRGRNAATGVWRGPGHPATVVPTVPPGR
ncbi:hypothetical protein Aut01nite_59070 [Actinoplanes utahensis]|nr:hypothetical protein Aut01nite_59070 [Actinoplanes utahensis]